MLRVNVLCCRWARQALSPRAAQSATSSCFAGTRFAAGRRWARTAVDVSIVAASVQLPVLLGGASMAWQVTAG
jgi:hypothetical protein